MDADLMGASFLMCQSFNCLYGIGLAREADFCEYRTKNLKSLSYDEETRLRKNGLLGLGQL